MPEPLTIRPTPPERQAAALELLFSHLSPVEKAGQMDLTLAAVRNRTLSVEGLLMAERGENIVGAVWASSLGGCSALVWPPQTSEREDDATAQQLLAAADGWMRSQQINLATAYLTDGDSPEARRLAHAGYDQASVIAYLVSDTQAFPEIPPASRLEFAPYTEADAERLIAIVDATYVGTQDCPRLNGVRETRDVIDGYRSATHYSPEHWLIARHEGQDVGCLLLADHPRDNHGELVYMGVVPAARGRGFGVELARHAQWVTRCAGRAALVLAVDAENSPAIRGYAACGFRQWERRTVMLKTL